MALAPINFRSLGLEEVSPSGGVLSDAIAKRLAMAKTQSAESEAPYAGLASLSKALSQNAYAGAVGPQMLAKAAENKAIWSNFPEETRRKIPFAIYNAASGGDNNAGQSGGANSEISKALMDIYHKQQQPRKGLLDSLVDHMAVGNAQTQQAISGKPESPQMADQQEDQSSYPQVQNKTLITPQAQQQAREDGIMDIDATSNQQPESIRNQANYEGALEEAKSKGKEKGTLREQQIDKFGDDYEGLMDQKNSLDYIGQLLQSPALERISNTPFINQKAISYYKNAGTDDEKRALGEIDSAMNTYIAASIKKFGGRFTNKDLGFLQNMKPNENDLLSVRKGKIQALNVFNELEAQKMKLTHDNMRQKGMSKLEAEDDANKKLKINNIENSIYRNLFPSRDDKMKILANQGYTKLMLSPPDENGKRKKAMVHSEDVENALKSGWSNG